MSKAIEVSEFRGPNFKLNTIGEKSLINKENSYLEETKRYSEAAVEEAPYGNDFQASPNKQDRNFSRQSHLYNSHAVV